MLTGEQWTNVQDMLRSRLGEDSFNSWLRPLRPAGPNETPPDVDATTTVGLVVPTRFMRDWVAKHFNDAICDGVREATGRDVAVTYLIGAPLEQPRAHNADGHPFSASSPAASSPAAHPAQPGATPHEAQTSAPEQWVAKARPLAAATDESTYGGNPLDPRFTFDTFITGKSNEFAYAAGRRIAESDDMAYNPLFLYGGVGLGKTHLMHAIAWRICETFPGRKVLYISAEKFLHNFIRALRDKAIHTFKDTFRSVDVLMIDDVQFIAGKEATQEEFFHTFNALVDGRKQVILTADRSPHSLDNIEDRLKSRLGSGLATEIHRPDLETRLAILDDKTKLMNVELDRAVAMFLADRIDTNIRELEGALNRLVAHATLVQQDITVESAKELLRDLLGATDRTVSMDDIQKKVADYYRIKLSDMLGAKRTRNLARPRQLAMYLAKTLTPHSFPEIGRAFGGRDHTTVIHASRQMEKLIAEDAQLAEDLRVLEGMLRGS